LRGLRVNFYINNFNVCLTSLSDNSSLSPNEGLGDLSDISSLHSLSSGVKDGLSASFFASLVDLTAVSSVP
jgi:hypothetical protein